MALQVWLPLNKDFKNIGLKGPFASATNVTFSTAGVAGNCASFNGSTSYLSFVGPVSSGTNAFSYAAWVKFNNVSATQCLFSQRTVVGEGYSIFLIGGKIRFDAGGNLWTTTATIAANTWIHIVVTYDGSVKKLYINGALSSSNTATTTSSVGEKATIGGSSEGNGVANNNRLNGFLYDVRIYDNALTPADVKDAYNGKLIKSPSRIDNDANFAWLRVLHHNNPKAARFATQEDAKNKTTKDQFSRLKVFFNNDNLRGISGSYEFMVKERLEATSAEQKFVWKQTSNPTASTVTGYELVSQTTNPGRSFGLKHNGSYAVFHNGSTWWCACGSVSEFNGGIPGFGGTVLTGCLDLYTKVDNKRHLAFNTVPSDYTVLDYIQSTGTQYIDTGINPKVKPRVVARFEFLNGDDKDYWGNGAKNGSAYYANFSGRKLTYYRYGSTTSININYTVNLNEIHEWDVSDKVYVDGVLRGQTSNVYTYNASQNTIQIFKAARSTYYSSYKLYEFKLYDGDELVRHLIPVRRKSDNVVGLYDLVSKSLFTNKGTGEFTAGPES